MMERMISRQMEGMRHRVPNSGKILRERFVLLSFAMLHCPSFSLLPHLLSSHLLSVWLPCLGCDPFSSLLMLSVAILRGSLADKMDSVYTPVSSAALPWLRVCGGQKGGGTLVRGKKGWRDIELARRQAWLHSTFTWQFYYLPIDRNSQSTLLVWLGKHSTKIPPLEM